MALADVISPEDVGHGPHWAINDFAGLDHPPFLAPHGDARVGKEIGISSSVHCGVEGQEESDLNFGCTRLTERSRGADFRHAVPSGRRVIWPA